MYDCHHYVNGAPQEGRSGRFAPIFNPSTGEQQGQVALASAAEVSDAVRTASTAFRDWAATPVVRRARVLQNLVQILYRDKRKLGEALSREHGKVLADAEGDVQRGLEVAEFAQGIPHLMKGEFSDNVSSGIDMYSMRKPLGVVAGITPFNFPAMIPLWMSTVAIACGNSFILKPSEKDPSVPLMLANCWREAGLPEGVFTVINGDREAVEALCTHPDIKAVSFVGSTAIAQSVYATATAHGKRCQAMGGAKNHMVVMPDADLDQVTDALIGSAYGSAGERCMAISVAVPVTDVLADKMVEMLKPRVEALKVGHAMDPDAELGPLVTAEHHARVKGYIDLAAEEGSRLVVDGRNFRYAMQGYEDGFYMAGSLLDRVKPGMKSYREEIFGPTLQILRAQSFEEALGYPSDHEYGNGTSIFTRDGDIARDYTARVEVGMVGVNVPIPVPLAFHSFGGWKNSAFGDINQHGMEGVRFFTKTKTVTQRWPESLKKGAEFTIPTFDKDA